VRVVARPYVISQGRFRGHFLRLNFTHYGRIYGENREFGGEYFVWAKKFQISKKYFGIFQKSLDISEIEISFPTSNPHMHAANLKASSRKTDVPEKTMYKDAQSLIKNLKPRKDKKGSSREKSTLTQKRHCHIGKDGEILEGEQKRSCRSKRPKGLPLEQRHITI